MLLGSPALPPYCPDACTAARRPSPPGSAAAEDACLSRLCPRPDVRPSPYPVRHGRLCLIPRLWAVAGPSRPPAASAARPHPASGRPLAVRGPAHRPPPPACPAARAAPRPRHAVFPLPPGRPRQVRRPPPAPSGPARKLEKQGLVERRAHPTDRRAKQIVLTAEGSSLRERVLELLAQDSPLAGLSPEQQRVLRDLLEQAIVRP